MVGVLVDTLRLSRTRTEFSKLFQQLGEQSAKTLDELKSSQLYKGRGSWSGVAGETRHAIITNLIDWLIERKHSLTLAAIDYDRWTRAELLLEDSWLAAALHTALQVQRCGQAMKNNKGMTALVFDEQKQKADSLAELLFSPPTWSDQYYGRRPKQAQLDQVLDTAFYAKSHHVGLVQVADIFAFVFRRYVELNQNGRSESYQGETDRMGEWAQALATRLIKRSHRWPARPDNEAAKWYVDLAPRSLLQLGI